MSNTKILMAVRVPENLHRKAKIQAFKEGKSLQDWITEIMDAKLKKSESKRTWLCQVCGDWHLEGTQVAMMGKCACCHKEGPIFPCSNEE